MNMRPACSIMNGAAEDRTGYQGGEALLYDDQLCK